MYTCKLAQLQSFSAKSAQRLPIAQKIKADFQAQINENNAVIERYQDEINETIGNSC